MMIKCKVCGKMGQLVYILCGSKELRRWKRTKCTWCTYLEWGSLFNPNYTCMKYNKLVGLTMGLNLESCTVKKGVNARQGFEPINERTKKWALGYIEL